jgi:hypothetical protein
MKRRYIATLTLACEADDIGEVSALIREGTSECFLQRGFALLDGHIARAREDKPIESVSLGSTEAYANLAARHDFTGLEVVAADKDWLSELGLAVPRSNDRGRSKSAV